MASDGFNFDAERQQTNTDLSTQLQRLQALTPSDLSTLVPDPGDRQQIEGLIATVNAATDRNQKLAVLQQKLTAGGSALAKLLTRIA